MYCITSHSSDDDIENDAILDCVENIEVDLFTDANLLDKSYNTSKDVDAYSITSWRKLDVIDSKVEWDELV